MRRSPFPWKELATVALAGALAWGLRGQHGHERGAAMAGAMIGLAIAAVTGGPSWIGAAVIGSLGFAIGGALSYGRFIGLAYQGSLEAIGSLALVGAAWGGFGGLGLGLGLSFPKYRRPERVIVVAGLFILWFLVDRMLWGRITGPEDMRTRELMVEILLVVWALLLVYFGIGRRDRAALNLALAGAAGFGLGFPLAAWIQGVGQAGSLPLDWWVIAEHATGCLGGLALGAAALSLESSWRLPRAVRPWERWMAAAWLLWLMPTWLMANNLDYWISERALFPVESGSWVWGLLFFWLGCLLLWGWLEMRRGRLFVVSWMPRHLRRIFLVFVWIITLIGASKSLLGGIAGSAPAGFLILAFLLTLLVQAQRPKPAP